MWPSSEPYETSSVKPRPTRTKSNAAVWGASNQKVTQARTSRRNHACSALRAGLLGLHTP